MTIQRKAILSDIHSNFVALEAVLADLARSGGVDQILCLGDIVGYGPQPEECVNRLRELGADSVMGNHEQGLININYSQRFNQPARDALRFTRAALSEDNYNWLVSRPKSVVIEGVRFVHGLPPSDVATYLWKYEGRMEDVFRLFSERICVVGHTHDLALYQLDGDLVEKRAFPQGVSNLSGESRFLINIGSVGQPRDGDNHAKYVLWNCETMDFEVRFVSYDIDKTAELIRSVGLHCAFADRLY